MADAIVIRTMNPQDISVEEAEGIAQAVRKLDFNCDVRVEGHERTCYGVTWFEVLRISLIGGWAFGMGKVFAEEVARKIADTVVEWARDRFKNRKNASKRPVYVAIYGPDGTIKSVVVKNATDQIEDRTRQDVELERHFKNKNK